ncbi:bifunctional diaminohydroxyphosphoribosylaminopyrimidine deaminase/5-amino-6-(5-phosphoribosylamino)uracil reductase RibD [Rhodoplanes sp. TEM]|uniref:Riboflavin biosynthesis protein RibD n=1 Tax=Rhodoplanes tepidamans TaxID=200616 RepID=A0ABT5J9Y8_RHOTP|nr:MULTISPECIES: bifunctional diaminohydroxyphosphoribosylaminopyrimidine deaminase/5-amino-6-(5-phosphoribosylamino)uracil reductase RibD [Rhodoplanes]MDC7786480.1 bifunctional diaminohydroxyphosphoribosylaminopyrimidine deaminase/5-amino-6-(5-phosphoribosylamino)uracil reductase RibD [Rhodoplanes tepidamans]MDC7985479.1 bifunctional diaminohydroxyphosphoribosylaminopyrimidine deaminase/5-amino-6-(5-phosphoribosylamino)uracil reductase RibD [Rhodoplanes sp. TEM]
MALALALGRRGLGNTWPNPAVGAVVVRFDGGTPRIVGRGWTQPGGRPHAETEALKRAGGAARGATLYVTLEPCSHHGKTPPCVDAIRAAGIARVVSAIEDPDTRVAGRGHAILRAAGLVVDVGVGADAAREAHAGHVRRILDGRPHVTLKMALSADGKVALAGRRPVAITAEAANARVHMMRAMHDAILVGIGTALSDDPLLTCRLPGLAHRSPVRVVVDAGLRLPAAARLVRTAGETPLWIVTRPDAPAEAAARLRAAGAHLIHVAPAAGGPGVDPDAALRALGALGVTRLLVEGGPTVAAVLVRADLVDAAVLLTGERPIGPDGLDPLEGLPLAALTGGPALALRATARLGPDRIDTYGRAAPA